MIGSKLLDSDKLHMPYIEWLMSTKNKVNCMLDTDFNWNLDMYLLGTH